MVAYPYQNQHFYFILTQNLKTREECLRGKDLDILVPALGHLGIVVETQDLDLNHIHQNEKEQVDEDRTVDRPCRHEGDMLEVEKPRKQALVSEFSVSVCIQRNVN